MGVGFPTEYVGTSVGEAVGAAEGEAVGCGVGAPADVNSRVTRVPLVVAFWST